MRAAAYESSERRSGSSPRSHCPARPPSRYTVMFRVAGPVAARGPSIAAFGRDRAKTGTRTQDLRITNAPLYQLSYLGVGKCCFRLGIPCRRHERTVPAVTALDNTEKSREWQPTPRGSGFSHQGSRGTTDNERGARGSEENKSTQQRGRRSPRIRVDGQMPRSTVARETHAVAWMKCHVNVGKKKPTQ